jgi:UDP-glucose 4-epimerase
MDIVDELKQLMPELEFILINQHIKLNQLLIKANDSINKQLDIKNPKSLKEELQEFISRLSF